MPSELICREKRRDEPERIGQKAIPADPIRPGVAARRDATSAPEEPTKTGPIKNFVVGVFLVASTQITGKL